MDDATSTIYSAILVEEEGTASSLAGLLETFAAHGLPSSLYTDRGSHYFVTPKAGGAVDRLHLTQVGRALERLGIEHIAAYSPEARGRSERMFGTLQDRLIKELAKAGIIGIEAANAWIKETYLPAHNARLRQAAGAARDRLRPGPRPGPARRGAEPAGGARRRPRQHGRLRRDAPAAARKPAAPSLGQGAGARARLPGWHARHLPRAAPHRPLHGRGRDADRRPPDRRPDGHQRDGVLGPVKDGLEGPRRRRDPSAAILDGACARRPGRGHGRDGETVA